jgi:alkaline phosphatase D
VIVDAIISQKLKNVVFIAGDVHYVQANSYDPNNDGQPDFYEFVVGPLSASPGRLTPPSPGLHPTNMINEGGYFNFGVIRATRSSLEATVIDEAGRTRFTHRLTAQ